MRVELERDLGAAGHLLGELPGGLLHEGRERVVQRAVVHAPPIRRARHVLLPAQARIALQQRRRTERSLRAATRGSGASAHAPVAPSHSVP